LRLKNGVVDLIFKKNGKTRGKEVKVKDKAIKAKTFIHNIFFIFLNL